MDGAGRAGGVERDGAALPGGVGGLSSLLSVTEVAQRYGVSRQTVYAWLARYEVAALAGLADRSHRPRHHLWQFENAVAALICQLRRAHPRWGPRRLRYELGVRGTTPVPSRCIKAKPAPMFRLVPDSGRN